MAKKGKRYPLLIYDYVLSKWYPATFAIAIFLFILWWFMPMYTSKTSADWRDTLLLSSGGAALVITVFLFFMRKSAYVRPYKDYLRIVTPFLRLNISYKRILRTRPTDMISLFPASTLSEWQFDSMKKLMGKTALVVELKSYPMSRSMLKFFLSPFFFKDNTPHFVFLIENWMGFSTDLESLGSGGSLPCKKK
jgi:hypothetical protein